MVIACLPTRRWSCLTCCSSSRTREAGTTSSPAATAVVPPRSTSLIQLRRTAGATSSSRDISAIVFSPELIRPTVSRLNSAENTRRPSERRGNSPISHQPFRSHHGLQKVSSRNGEQSIGPMAPWRIASHNVTQECAPTRAAATVVTATATRVTLSYIDGR